jgi:hypothetical protein
MRDRGSGERKKRVEKEKEGYTVMMKMGEREREG